MEDFFVSNWLFCLFYVNIFQEAYKVPLDFIEEPILDGVTIDYFSISTLNYEY